jgi:hypothetical protein
VSVFTSAGVAVRSLVGASRVVALSFVVTTLQMANAQSGLPRLDPEIAQELFGAYASCIAYWKVMSKCLLPGLKQEDKAQLRRSFDQLQSVGAEQMKWLGTKAKLSAGMQKRITEQARGRMTAAIGSKCENGPVLLQEYRDKCAALFKNIAAAQKEGPSAVTVSRLPELITRADERVCRGGGACAISLAEFQLFEPTYLGDRPYFLQRSG